MIDGTEGAPMAVPMDVTAQGFMIAESRRTPMHVGGLQLFEPPEDAGPDWARTIYERSLESPAASPLWLKRPHRSLATGGMWGWTQDDEFDLEYHARHSALPAPGRIRELLELVGRLHGTRLALERPLWEMHFIEGLADGRVAIYAKLHHALVDGVAAMRLLQSALSTDPDDRDTPAPWAVRDPWDGAERDQPPLAERWRSIPGGAARSALAISAEAAGLTSTLLRTLDRGLRDESAPMALYAPRTILNRTITGARRVAAEHWDVERVHRVAKSADATINDVVLAMCSGALRHYLAELDELPEQSLVAMVPVSLTLREGGKASVEGSAVGTISDGNTLGTIMVKLGTDLADPGERLAAVRAGVRSGKEAMAGMTPTEIVAMSGLGVAPAVLLPMLGLQGLARPPFNLVISNVPGPKQPLYWHGARLTDMYPLSIPLHGQAMNITVASYDGMLNFGLTGCRRTAPSLQRLLTHLDDELSALEKAAGVG
ncbi:MAG: Wax ester synthase/acyl-CoA:diacylglycerol acyltransferase [uncultured Nocardioidaceae bacterium]|uniref:Diacylglycerol O-acyltransferase n=1 Tax=uncultured Nocardioidaceae bacterium TaxID=253824 RepID=A0A6J4MBF3_9ACTN|nr:MAG: Wax ester synthase/acyl-CoA:diacylglycerol acyltransferase [uncultured Nocardioidaceae bacterium]